MMKKFFCIRNMALLLVFPAALFFSCKSEPKYNPDMVADMDPIPVGAIELEMTGALGVGIDKKTAELVFVPRRNQVYLQYRVQTVLYRQYWDKPAREKFLAALSRYKEDYVSRDLSTNRFRTRSIYGTAKGYTEWGYLTQFATTIVTDKSYAYPLYEIGYSFQKKAPYFTIVQNAAKDITTTGRGDTDIKSTQFSTFFTRAQADELAALFDQNLLVSLTGAQAFKDSTPVRDDYDAYNGLPSDSDYE
jgi:hypothetical protein